MRSVLELGCGGGNNAFHLKARFQMTLTDVSPGMLAHSRLLNLEPGTYELFVGVRAAPPTG